MHFKNRKTGLFLFFLINMSFFILPLSTIFISNLNALFLNNMPLSTNSLNLILIHVDTSGDGFPSNHPSTDIQNIYENVSMDLLNVSFGGNTRSNTAGDMYAYKLEIDADNDNSTTEYTLTFQETVGSFINCHLRRSSDSYYWNSSSQTWTLDAVNDTNLVYNVSNYIVFNFSTCPDCIGDNYYKVLSELIILPMSMYSDFALGSYVSTSFFAGLTSKPTIQNVNVNPRNDVVNSNFTFTVNVTDPNGTDTVLATIKSYPNLEYITQVELFDDGFHNDGSAGDDIYGNSWNSTGNSNGTYYIDIYANDTFSSARNLSQAEFFVIGEVGESPIFDGLAMDHVGSFNYSVTNGIFLSYSHFHASGGTEIFPSVHYFTGQNEKHETDNVTRIIRDATILFGTIYLEKGAFDPYWIHNNARINDSIYIYVRNSTLGRNLEFNVTSIEKIAWKDTEIWCWQLENAETGSIAYYENSTGILINGSFYPAPQQYTYEELEYTNNLIETGPDINIKTPLNQSYYTSSIPLMIENNSFVESMWARNNSGAGWSQPVQLEYTEGVWKNITELTWQDGQYQLEVFANDSLNRTTLKTLNFTVDTYGPEIYVNVYNLSRIGALTEIEVVNLTSVDKMWYRNSTNGIAWSENYSIEYDISLGMFINNTANISNIGSHYLEIYANDTSGEETNRSIIFTIQYFPINVSQNLNCAISDIGRIITDNNGNLLILTTIQQGSGSPNSQVELFNISENWIRHLNITTPSSTYSMHYTMHSTPQMEIDSLNTVHITWMEMNIYQMDFYYGFYDINYDIKYVNNEKGWFSIEQNIPNPADGVNNKFQHTLEVNSSGCVFVTFLGGIFQDIYSPVTNLSLYITNNSLGTFSIPENITSNCTPAYFSTIMDSADLLHVIYSRDNAGNLSIYYVNSSNWSQSQLVYIPGQNLGLDVDSSYPGIVHLAWINNASKNYTVMYTNNSNGNFDTPKNISWFYDADISGLNIEVSNKSEENLVFITWSTNETGNYESYSTNNTGNLFSDWPIVINMSSSSLNEKDPLADITTNPGESFITWIQSDSYSSFSELILEELDTKLPTGLQDTNTQYPYTNQSGVSIWVNGTASDPSPSFGLKSVEIINSSTPGNLSDWTNNLGTLTNWAFKNSLTIPEGIYEIDVLIKDNMNLELKVDCTIRVLEGDYSLIEPINTTYSRIDIPIRLSNNSYVDKSWYRNNTGMGWSNNYSLSYISGEWTNSSPIYWPDAYYQLQVFVNDTKGVEYNVNVNFTIDTVFPTIIINIPTNGSLNTDSTTWINGTVDSTGSYVSSISINSSHFEIYENPTDQVQGAFSFRNKTDVSVLGNYTLNVSVIDSGGLMNHSIISFAVDNLPPNLTLTVPAGNGVSGSIIWFNGTVNGTGSLLTLYCNDSRFSTEVDPNSSIYSDFALKNKSSISNGNITLNLTVVDQAGYKNEYINTFHIDNEIPTIILTEPSVVTHIGTVWFNGTVNGTGSPLTLYFNDSRFSVEIDPNGTFNGTFSLKNSTVLPEGALWMNLTVIDEVGFKSENITLIYIDRTSPNIEITNPVNGSYLRDTIWINGNFNATGSIIKQVIINNSDFEVFEDPINRVSGTFSFRNKTSITCHGNYSVNITLIDDAGFSNYSIVNFFVDNLIPTIELDFPANGTIIGSSNIWINGTINSTGSWIIFVALNGSIFNTNNTFHQNNTATYDFNFVNESIMLGNYTFQITFVDGLGYVNYAIINFYVDYLLPNITITTPLTNTVSGEFIWINGTVNGTGSAAMLYFNDSRFTAQGNNPNGTLFGSFALKSESYLPDGRYWINLTVQDQTGSNIGLNISFFVDNTIPDINNVNIINGSVISDPIIWINGTVNATGSIIDSFLINNTDFYAYWDPSGNQTANFAIRNVSNVFGLISINITVIDDANWINYTILNFYVDYLDPTLVLDVPSTNIVTGNAIWFNGTANGTGSLLTLYCNDSRFSNVTLEGNPNGTFSGNFELKNNSYISDGNLTLNLTIIDLTGAKYELIKTIYIDNTIPDINITNNINGSTPVGNVIWINGTFNATGLEITSFEFNYTSHFGLQSSNPEGQDIGSFSIWNTTILYDGYYAIRINLTDSAGLTNFTVIYFTIDNLLNLNPTIQLINPSLNGTIIGLNDSYGPNLHIIEGYARGISNDISNIWVNSSDWFIVSNPSGNPEGAFIFSNYSVIPDGLHWVLISVNNTDTNTTTILLSFYIDLTPPTTPQNFNGTVSGNNVTLTWDAVIDATNVTYVIYRNGTNIANTTALTYTDSNLTPGVYNYTIVAIDSAGHFCTVAAQKIVTVGSTSAPPSSPPTFDWWIIIIIIIIIVGAVGVAGGIVVYKKRSGTSKTTYYPPEKIKLEDLIKPKDKGQKSAAKATLDKTITPKQGAQTIPPPKGIPTKPTQKPIQTRTTPSIPSPKTPAILEKTPPAREKPIIVRPKITPEKPRVPPQQTPSIEPKPAETPTDFIYICEHCNKYFKVNKQGIFTCPNCQRLLKLFDQ
ncbi:MAG: hypothetical protein EAX96_19070 [Candidatus Lokiarchaeota archaeon]|nr:hypothetical protein [Candidatus Lokiarchaeota archaeon]